jgi:hypothetical protein
MPGIQNSKSTLDFLGTLGNKDKGDGYPAVAKALAELAGFLIERATRNLQKGGNTATGATAASMKIVNVDLEGPVKSLDVEILKTYTFLDLGVKGVEGGKGKYSFKTKFANKKMALAILKWLRKRSVATKYKAHSSYSDNLRGDAKGRQERKNQAIKKIVNDAESKKRLAYAISVNIKKKGIKPTYFFRNAVRDTQKEAKKKLGAAIKFDIINSLN